MVAGNALALNLTDILGYGDYEATGAEAFALNDTDGSSDDATAFLLLESAGYRNGNRLGIYDYDVVGGNVVVGNTLEVFNGPASPITSITLAFDIDAGTVTNTGTGLSAEIDTTFGFYLAAADGNTYYSHTALNADSVDHLQVFDTRDNSVGALLGSDVVLAWEDLYGGGDLDFNDLVVGVSDIHPVPEPGTVLLLGVGLLGLIGLGRKRIKK